MLTTNLALAMTMSVPSTTTSQSASCASPDATTGIGVCTLTVASARFSTSEDVATIVSMAIKYSGIEVAVSNSVGVTLVKQPTFDALTAAGMTATLPHYPHRTGDMIEVEIAANTDEQALNVWVVDVP